MASSSADASLHSPPIASGLLSLHLPSSSSSLRYATRRSSVKPLLQQRRFPSLSPPASHSISPVFCRFPHVSMRFPQISSDPPQFGSGNTSVERTGGRFVVNASSSSSARPASQPRFIQHKQEAFWFYRFLSIVYDHVINPGHWTVDMREDALEPADLNDPNLTVVDVGGGTGFCTQGIVKTVHAKNVTILDQSPHQLAKAREKEDLKECSIVEGDAEDLPFPTDSVDRYVSAGSIEYWPDPQRGITEAYRVLKKGGKACLIGPVHPTFWLSRFFADVWMLFPTEEEYIEWFTKAGFSDVKIKRIGPSWYRGVRRHGLIMGCSVTGVKPESGESPLRLGPKAEDVRAKVNPFVFLYRFLLGVIASAYYVLVPIYMWLKDQIVPKGQPL